MTQEGRWTQGSPLRGVRALRVFAFQGRADSLLPGNRDAMIRELNSDHPLDKGSP